jgi:hypothetical protein
MFLLASPDPFRLSLRAIRVHGFEAVAMISRRSDALIFTSVTLQPDGAVTFSTAALNDFASPFIASASSGVRHADRDMTRPPTSIDVSHCPARTRSAAWAGIAMTANRLVNTIEA